MEGDHSNTVLIIGGTGKVGRQLTKLFAATPVQVYQASRKGSTTTEAGAENIKPIAFDWDDKKTWNTVLEVGATSVFLVAPPGGPLPPVELFIDQARLKGHVKRFVLLSGSPVEPDINSQGMGRPHAYLKQLGEKGEVEWAAIRPTWFQQNFAELENYRDSIVKEGVIYSATGDGRIPWVATEDIAACAFQLLTQKNAPNDEYLILGPELLSYGDVSAIAEVLSKTLGREITHKNLSVDELVDYYVRQGLPTHIAEMLGNADLAIRNGSEDRMNSVVVELTGKRPSRFCDFAEKNKKTWASQA
ncbi:AFUA_2G17970 family ergot alkaloid biosynthesis protein [Colletotrichum limetticola]|uniref:AFUA_2G17970 family ergot alkaloid biosynthesis protein n=1 Tax=Colletotrichum limetticola TaxID=1209924 RepID=A0ABQ9PS11_9PEZI|nr:AFUA_2G17970 family ergot alkaloid biosynthesis protein [Colletotrichum limetticola]